jgi:hypothetical protein
MIIQKPLCMPLRRRPRPLSKHAADLECALYYEQYAAAEQHQIAQRHPGSAEHEKRPGDMGHPQNRAEQRNARQHRKA